MFGPAPKKNFEEWKQSQTAYQKGDIIRPNWHGGMTKGGNAYDFSGLELSDLHIFSAFAEGLTIANATFKNVIIEEGDFSRSNFSNCQFINTRFNKTILTDATFEGATFINCNLNRVNLTNSNFCVKEIRETVIYGISAWDLKVSESSIQSKLVIEKTYEFYSDLIARGHIPMMVDDIELAQFIYYLSNHKKMRDTLNILNSKGVLLLGRFGDGGLERLYQVREWFLQRNYLPMIFDFDRPDMLDYTETVLTLSGLSKLIVADLSGGSVPQELHAILTNFNKPVLAYHTDRPYSMFKDLQRRNDYVLDFKFDGTVPHLLATLETQLPIAEKGYREIMKELAEQY